MKHIIFGGDGFVGRHLAQKLLSDGEEVVIADIVNDNNTFYRDAAIVRCDVTRADDIAKVPMAPGDMVYNLSAKMLSPLQVRAKRHDFFYPVNYDGTKNIMEAMNKAGLNQLVHFTTDMIYGHTLRRHGSPGRPVFPTRLTIWVRSIRRRFASCWAIWSSMPVQGRC